MKRNYEKYKKTDCNPGDARFWKVDEKVEIKTKKPKKDIAPIDQQPKPSGFELFMKKIKPASKGTNLQFIKVHVKHLSIKIFFLHLLYFLNSKHFYKFVF